MAGLFSRRTEAALWPILLLLLLGALLPTACILWLLNAAITNERLAAREKLRQAYSVQLDDVDQLTEERFAALAQRVVESTGNTPDIRFSLLSVEPPVAGAIILDTDRPRHGLAPAPEIEGAPVDMRRVVENLGERRLANEPGPGITVGQNPQTHTHKLGREPAARKGGTLEVAREEQSFNADRVRYPDTPNPAPGSAEKDARWRVATRLEHVVEDLHAAHDTYLVLSNDGTYPPARRLEAKLAAARCLDKGNERSGALALLEAFLEVVPTSGETGRRIDLDGTLRLLELAERGSEQHDRASAGLKRQLTEGSGTPIPASQRRLLLRHIQQHAPDPKLDALLVAELRVARLLEKGIRLPEGAAVEAVTDGLVAWRAPESDAILLFDTGELSAWLAEPVRGRFAGTAVQPVLLPSDQAPVPEDHVARDNAGPFLPGWRWILRFESGEDASSTAERQVLIYWWTAIIVLLTATLLVFFGSHRVLYHLRLARWKNDLTLTPKEFNVLALLATHAGRAFSRDEILRRAWGHSVFVSTRSVDRCITTLRAKLEHDPARPNYIKTVRTVGYRFEPPVTP